MLLICAYFTLSRGDHLHRICIVYFKMGILYANLFNKWAKNEQKKKLCVARTWMDISEISCGRNMHAFIFKRIHFMCNLVSEEFVRLVFHLMAQKFQPSKVFRNISEIEKRFFFSLWILPSNSFAWDLCAVIHTPDIRSHTQKIAYWNRFRWIQFFSPTSFFVLRNSR